MRRGRRGLYPGNQWFRLFDLAAGVALGIMDRRERKRRGY